MTACFSPQILRTQTSVLNNPDSDWEALISQEFVLKSKYLALRLGVAFALRIAILTGRRAVRPTPDANNPRDPNHDRRPHKECISLWRSALLFWCPLIQWQFSCLATPYNNCPFRLMPVGKCQRRLVY